MNDPFDVLRQPPEYNPVRAVPDDAFRSTVLAESRRRLAAGSDDVAGTRAHDPSRPILLEPNRLPGAPVITRRPLVLAAACVVLVAFGATAMLALSGRSNPDDDPSPAEVGSAGLVEATAPPTTSTMTTAPTLPATTTAAAVAAATDERLANSLLLTEPEYGGDWTRESSSDQVGSGIDPAIAAEVSECREYLPTVFEPIDAAAHVDLNFTSQTPPFAGGQYSVLLRDSTEAERIFTTLNDAAFAPCSRAYTEAVTGSNCCDGRRWLPALFHDPTSAAPFDTAGMTLAFRQAPVSWRVPSGEEYGPYTVFNAVILHDRSISIITALAEAAGTSGVSVEEFGRSVRLAIRRMEAATGVQSQVPISTAAETLLTATQFGTGWSEISGLGSRVVSFEASELAPECGPYAEVVFAVMASGDAARREFSSSPPNVDIVQQHVTQLASTEQASEAFAALTDDAFISCARMHDDGYAALAEGQRSPTPFELDADEAAFYRFDHVMPNGTRRNFSAVIARVGNVITYLETFNGVGDSQAVTSDADFAVAVSAALSNARRLADDGSAG